jgi:hypothetical protein
MTTNGHRRGAGLLPVDQVYSASAATVDLAISARLGFPRRFSDHRRCWNF